MTFSSTSHPVPTQVEALIVFQFDTSDSLNGWHQ
jgi:antibiotic biosynthesis monooxygenase (ABM) superfamily enzyme